MMSKYLVLTLLIGIVIFSSCVPNKKILYLQTKDELKKDYRIDSALRTYDLPEFTYKLKPEDILSIRIQSLTADEYDFFEDNQSNQMQGNPTVLAISGYLIDKEGNIEFPVVGKIHLAGLTIEQAQSKVQQIADSFLASPVVRLRLLNYRVTVLGEVNKEGTIELLNNRVTLTEVIGRLGGFTDLANRSNVKIVRQGNDEINVVYVDLLKEDFLASSYYYVHNNDLIIVEPLRQRPFRQYFGPNLSLIVSSISLLLITINLIN